MKDAIERLADLYRERFAPIRVEIISFPSGSVMMDVWQGGRFFVLTCDGDRNWTVCDVREGDAFDAVGLTDTFDNFSLAERRLTALIEDQAERMAAINRIAEVEKRVAALESASLERRTAVRAAVGS